MAMEQDGVHLHRCPRILQAPPDAASMRSDEGDGRESSAFDEEGDGRDARNQQRRRRGSTREEVDFRCRVLDSATTLYAATPASACAARVSGHRPRPAPGRHHAPPRSRSPPA